MSLPDDPPASAVQIKRKRSRFELGLTGIALLIPIALFVIVLFLGQYAWQAIGFNGIRFIGTIDWSLGNLYMNPVVTRGYSVPLGANYGILAFIVGTLFSSFLALLFALPVAVGTAIFLAEAVPERLRPALSLLVELVAVVPSVVFGLWGIYVLAPLISHYIGPGITAVLGFIPFFNIHNSTGSGFGLLAAAIVLALMITPIIATTLYDALRQVPRELRESAVALGATRFEVVIKTMLPTVRVTLVGGVVLGLGRALGETMAVLMVSGGALNYLPKTLFTPISTMAAFILSQLDSALGDPTNMAVKSLAEIALVLFLITLAVNALARVIVRGATFVRNV
ncbi:MULTISPECIES: phosphate ABC transporter permease subunit PstC [Acidiphilium]|uniref:Phosphate transport system permease protein n=1 Tax=Acidiphilium rubrum TaxID=526 RepID=A0A8G2FFY2_ACIRU|nr:MULTISPECIES: phosphate ABC transporter permease subunit PstC [Acidiphilium]MBW4034212.1 phosphate ABC transporter permease subunit PstC [Pseudomonadota bacterium]OYW02362.1 MAG: phosphate ABC transporter permease subunit PstC [Acidiphilium sp. 37-64-53]OZB30165.1 MAG: phosphate ABC transporter permease subunit PstC [Acidiphilium sp. 34-64-41]SIQ49638.1 phosphate ABC transporter membrane protein 1, PhoT family [Acidiphilium rubrum]HQT84501.1 phosphate ABC transporter permease subunit PstC [